jgi:hypothetical protein
MDTRLRFRYIHFVVLCITLLSACAPGKQRFLLQQQIIRRNTEYNKSYLQNGLGRARACLDDSARLLENATVLEPIGRAQLLSLTYFRWYVLEIRSGNQTEADACLIKAQFWSLKKGELTKVDVGTAVREIREFSRERIIEYVDKVDRQSNQGKDPEYLKAIRETQHP